MSKGDIVLRFGYTDSLLSLPLLHIFFDFGIQFDYLDIDATPQQDLDTQLASAEQSPDSMKAHNTICYSQPAILYHL